MAAIALRHVTFITSGKVFVLGGKSVRTERGVATVDLDGDGPLVALSLWHLGYRINDETGEEIRTVGDLDALVFADILDETSAEPEPLTAEASGDAVAETALLVVERPDGDDTPEE